MFVECDYDGLAGSVVSPQGIHKYRKKRARALQSKLWAKLKSTDINIWSDLSSLRPAGAVCEPASVGLESVE